MMGFCLNQLMFSFFDVPIALSAFVVAQAPKYMFLKSMVYNRIEASLFQFSIGLKTPRTLCLVHTKVLTC